MSPESFQPTDKSADDGPRERLLVAALEVFGELGYSATSTRMLAERAGVNLAAIPYYFSGKKGLYLAVAAHIAERMQAAIAPAMAAVDARLDAEPDDDELRGLLRGVLFGLADVLIGSKESARWAPFIMREQAHPTEAFEVLHKNAMSSTMGRVATILGRLLRQPPDSEHNVIVMETIFGQILVFRASRAAALRALGWDDFTPERLERLKDHIWRNTQAILDAQRSAGGAS